MRVTEQTRTADGLVIDSRVQSGYTAPIGSTDEDRLRHPTMACRRSTLASSIDAQQQGASDQQLQQIAAEALREVYFLDGGRCADSLEESRFTDIEHCDFDL
ncbi:telomere-protecting terminal protein Tpg [Streptomyces sp. NPDC058451]|uniref:telomere-protecting terminal protein Tpg n=1 Tax=Streptomyces sp. NPDC058451 TaxID=3346506 RepID=UPI003658C577